MTSSVCFHALFGVTVIVTIGGLAAVLVIIWTMPDIGSPRAQWMCLSSSPFQDSGTPLRCGNTADRLADYLDTAITSYTEHLQEEEIEKVSEEDKKHAMALKSFMKKNHFEVKPAARLSGCSNQDSRPYDSGDELVPIRDWRIGHRDFLRYGVSYRNGRLVVPVSGTYNIYSFMDMQEATEHNVHQPQCVTPIEQAIFKYNILRNSETELIRNVRPHQKSKSRYFNTYSSFLSSAVELESGDEIYVKVSNISYITRHNMNYFGVHLL